MGTIPYFIRLLFCISLKSKFCILALLEKKDFISSNFGLDNIKLLKHFITYETCIYSTDKYADIDTHKFIPG